MWMYKAKYTNIRKNTNSDTQKERKATIDPVQSASLLPKQTAKYRPTKEVL